MVNILPWRCGSGGAHLYTKCHGHTQHYLLLIGDPLPEAICVAMATCNLVGKVLLLVCQITLS